MWDVFAWRESPAPRNSLQFICSFVTAGVQELISPGHWSDLLWFWSRRHQTVLPPKEGLAFFLCLYALCSPFCGYALNMYSGRDWWSHFQAKVINAHLKHETWTWNGTSSILAENWQSLQLDVSGSILRVKNQCRVEKICKDEKNQCVSRFAKVFTHTLLLSSRPFSPCTKSFQRKVLIRNNMCSCATMLAGTNCYDHGRHPWEQTQKT